MRLLSFVLLIAVAAACSNSDGTLTPAASVSFRAAPEAFFPNDTVLLLPVFRGGTGRIDPDVGAVQSGEAYRVGPSSIARRYVLTVESNGTTATQVLDVPLRYRERTGELPPSPIVRTRHGAATLPDGRALLVGGASTSPVFWANTETFTPGTDGFAPAGELSATRAEPQVVVLSDGSALLFGGPINQNSFELATRVEQWDPTAPAWSVRGNLTCSRQDHTATRLLDDRVLVAGGVAAGGLPDDRDAELWVPGLGSRPPAGEMQQLRAGHTATLLFDGRVLLVGGYDPGAGKTIATAEVFDPDLDQFLPAGNLANARSGHAAVRLFDGRVLVVGGEDSDALVATAEIFEPWTGQWSPAGGLGTPRTEVRALRLGDGSVLVAGGLLAAGVATDRIEIWEPVTAVWRPWTGRLPRSRTGHSLHLLPDGRIVVLGGDAGTGFPEPTAFVLD